MKPRNLAVPIAALAVALGSFSAEAAQRDRGERRDRGTRSEGQQRSRGGDDSARQRSDSGSQSSADRGSQRTERRGRESQPQDQNRATASAEAQQQPQRDNQASARRDSSARDSQRDSRTDNRSSSYSRDRNDRNDNNRGRYDNNRSSNDRGRYDNNRGYSSRGNYDRGNSYNRGNYSRSYYAPRIIQRRSNYRHYYGSGGHLSLYFNIGSGYRYGSPYSGRVYGYRRNVISYGNYVAYGDVRLKISPRDAQVYVDGYYAGVVDDFDGFFQRLTLEVGPHEIEVVASGQSQFYDVYVDPNNTVDLHGDLFGEQYDDRDR